MSEITNAMKQICAEKGLEYGVVLETIEAALAAAYRKDFGSKQQNIKVSFNPETSAIDVFDIKEVVADEYGAEYEVIRLKEEAEREARELEEEKNPTSATEKKKKREEEMAEEARLAEEKAEGEEEDEMERFNPKTQMKLTDAKFIDPKAKIGEEIKIKLEVPGEFGRMAAQTAKQVIIQKLREAEREFIFGEFKTKEKEVVAGTIQRQEGRLVLIDLGRAVGILPPEEQIRGERYKLGERIKVYVKEVRQGARGAEIILSRVSDEVLKRVFYLEIPEIPNGLVEIKAVAREAGARSKVAVWSDEENVDPIGSCVGQRGSRIQTIISELGGEKVDIILYDADPKKFIMNALAPAKILSIELFDEDHRAVVKVASDQFSLAIGREGQNVRLAAHLTGWKIDIEEENSAPKAEKEEGEEIVESEENSTEEVV